VSAPSCTPFSAESSQVSARYGADVLHAVLFDIGGVLEITPPTGWPGRWEQELGLEPGELGRRLDDVWRGGSIGAVSEQEVARAVVERLGLGPADLERFLGDLWGEYLGAPNTELIDWFAARRPRYRTGIVSNSFVGAREKERERYGLEELTDTIVYSHEAGVAKPDPVIYLEACRRLEVRPEEAVFLDDVEAAVEGARAVGMAAVVYRDNEQAITELEALLAG
jgi:FMN phosphatase YigB (HAD superfamily)